VWVNYRQEKSVPLPEAVRKLITWASSAGRVFALAATATSYGAIGRAWGRIARTK